MLNAKKQTYRSSTKTGFLATLVFFMALLGHVFSLNAQQVRVKLEPDSIQIGQRATFLIEVDAPVRSIVHWSEFTDSIAGQIEILSFGRVDTLFRDSEKFTLGQQLKITSWEPGFIAIAPAPFLMVVNGDTSLVESEPLLLHVQAPELAEDATPFDIKPIFKVPVTLAEILPWLLIVIFAVIAGWMIRRYLRKRKQAPAKESIWEKPDIPAHIAAISSLESLKNKKLWQNGWVKLYHSELTFILRMYLEKRFGLIALEMTSAEILQAIPGHVEEEEQIESLRYILDLADLVKFAKFNPEPQQNEECMELAFDFVKRNIPPPSKEESKGKTKEQQ